MSRRIQVFEYEKLTLYPNDLGQYLEKKELIKLLNYNDRNDNVYFTAIRDGIKFKNYVGVIQIGGLTIEILPKADKSTGGDAVDRNKWQAVLLRMLDICRKLSYDSISEAALKVRHYSLLDLYFKMFLDEVSLLIRRGLIKKYRRSEGNVHALKGRLLFSRNTQQNLIHQERFYTEHQVYDYEHLHNQILLRALNVLMHISTNPDIIDRIHRLLFDFPDIKEKHISAADFQMLKENRKTKPYRNATKIAKMIILNYAPDISGGREDMLALLFDMNKLWEEYVYRMLDRYLQQEDDSYRVSFQNTEKFWENKIIKPDIVIEQWHEEIADYKPVRVIDTKWKLVNLNEPGDNDLKQMFAYNIYWETKKSILLYPGNPTTKESFGWFHKGMKDRHRCKVAFVNVMTETGILDENLGEKIFEKLEINE